MPGILVGLLGVGRIDGDQLVQLLAHLVSAVLDTAVDQGAHLIDLALLGQCHHLGLGFEVVVQGDAEGFVQRSLLRACRQRGVFGLGGLDLVSQHANARLGFLQGGRLAVDQHAKRQDAHAQHVFGDGTQVSHAGQLVRAHVLGGLAHLRHTVDRKHAQQHH